MFQKKICCWFVLTVVVFCLTEGLRAGQISSAGSTNNIANFDGYTNVIDGGRWSYLDEAYAPYTSNGVMGTQFTPGVDWAAAAPDVQIWVVRYDGAIFTDSRGTAFNYTFDAADASTGWARITGTYGGPGGHRLIINKVADSSLTTIDSGQTVTLLDQSSESVITFDITIPIAAGNDITFIGVDNLYWWEPYTLDATITAVSTPVTTITVLDPNGGQLVQANQPYTIKWQSSGQLIQKVLIEYSTNNGTTWKIAGKDVPNSGSYAWSVLSGLNSNQCRVRISSADPVVTGVSANVFTVFEDQATADLNGDHYVDMPDLASFVNSWLQAGM